MSCLRESCLRSLASLELGYLQDEKRASCFIFLHVETHFYNQCLMNTLPQFLCLMFSSKIRKLQWCEIVSTSSTLVTEQYAFFTLIEDHFIFKFFHFVYQLQFPHTPFLLFPSSPSSHHHAFFRAGKPPLESHISLEYQLEGGPNPTPPLMQPEQGIPS